MAESAAPPGNNGSKGGGAFGLVTGLFLALGVLVLYYLYRALYTTSPTEVTTLVGGKTSAATPPEKIPAIPIPFEGGEYTFNTWIYVNSFNRNMNTRKHIFELQGANFSTLLVALGAFKNSLVVRTHSKDIGATTEGFQGNNMPGGSGSSTAPPNASSGCAKDGALAKGDVSNLFKPLAMDDGILDVPPICDLPEVDLQRWVLVTVVLNGRTIDVYLDGKLSRSCVTGSFYKVDPTGIKAVVCGRGGFDGYISNMTVANYAMNPDEIYRQYLTGPEGASTDLFTWFFSMLGMAPTAGTA